MKELMKMLLYRIRNDKGYLITYLVLIPIIILIAIFFTNNISAKINIAVIGTNEIPIQSENIIITKLEEEPTDAELVIGKYDAVVIFEGDTFEVKTTKGEEVKQSITEILMGDITKLNTEENTRGSVSNIFGFIMMVILLLGIQMYTFYFEERNGINKRIIGTNISCIKYLLSHFIIVLLFLFIPTAVMIIGAIFLFNITTVVSVLQILFILFVLCLFGASLGLLINTMSKSIEVSFTYGNMIVILTTIISGGFAEVTDNKIFSMISAVFPQKQIMNLTIGLENGTNPSFFGMVYIIALSIIFIVCGIVIERKLIAHR